MRAFFFVAILVGGITVGPMPEKAFGKPRHPSEVGPIVAPVALEFTGKEAFGEKRERCRDTMRRFGAKLDDGARIRIVIHLQAFKNHVRVVEGGKVVFEEKLPIWTVPDLCQEALAEAMKIARRTR